MRFFLDRTQHIDGFIEADAGEILAATPHGIGGRVQGANALFFVMVGEQDEAPDGLALLGVGRMEPAKAGAGNAGETNLDALAHLHEVDGWRAACLQVTHVLRLSGWASLHFRPPCVQAPAAAAGSPAQPAGGLA